MFKIKFLIILLLMFILGCSNEKNELSEKLYSKNIEIKNVHVTNNSTKVSYDETQGHIILDLNREDNPDTNWNENQYSNLFLDFNVGINDLEKKNSLRENVEKYLKNNKSDETIIDGVKFNIYWEEGDLYSTKGKIYYALIGTYEDKEIYLIADRPSYQVQINEQKLLEDLAVLIKNYSFLSNSEYSSKKPLELEGKRK